MIAAAVAVLASALSCSRRLGYGVLLWSDEDSGIPSGTVLPVHIRSNIDGVWVVGIPEEYRGRGSELDKLELPLWQLEFVGSKSKALSRAQAFSEFAAAYGETTQDGLPIRAEPDNGARRVYRLRLGQIVKILGRAAGNPVMSGDAPLPGEWLQVLTDDGAVGYCYSYRLRIFEHSGGPLVAETAAEELDPEQEQKLEPILSRVWSPDWYKEMVDRRQIDLERFSDRWGFFPAQDTGIVHLSLPDIDRAYQYSRIVPAGENSWRFEGAPLQMTLRSTNLLAVQHLEAGGAQRTYLFTALPVDVKDLAAQETERRSAAFRTLYDRGPLFRSENYGTLAFTQEGGFSWTSFDLLVPAIVPADARGAGSAELRLFVDPSLQGLYDGALTLRFDRTQARQEEGAPDSSAPAGRGSDAAAVDFLYKLEPTGLRLEHVPPAGLEGAVVRRRAPSPVVIYFFSSER